MCVFVVTMTEGHGRCAAVDLSTASFVILVTLVITGWFHCCRMSVHVSPLFAPFDLYFTARLSFLVFFE